MSFQIIYDLNKRDDEFFRLLKQGKSQQEDELGFSKDELIPIQEIYGIIQESQDQEIDFKGEESNPQYTGYFLPDFILETSEVANYRIEYKRPHETLLLKVQKYDPNLFLMGERDHIQMELVLEKKYIRSD